MEKPLVSINCITYNHEAYIRECLNGLLMQRTTFPFEVLVHDDASTDNTQAIILEYKEKYPTIIKPYFQKENQYSKGKGFIGLKINFERAKGKYIAICEGDDYWTDPLKLQKQVDFLESNPNFGFCTHKYQLSTNIETDILPKISEDTRFSLRDYVSKGIWYTQPLTAVIRASALKQAQNYPYHGIKDAGLFYSLLKVSEGYIFAQNMGTYRITGNGVWTSLSLDRKIVDDLSTKLMIYDTERDELSAAYIAESLRHAISRKNMIRNAKIFWKAFSALISNFGLRFFIRFFFDKYFRLKKTNNPLMKEMHG